MPIMDGYEASTIIRSMEEEQNLREIPIVAMTGIIETMRGCIEVMINIQLAAALMADRERCLQVGMSDFVQYDSLHIPCPPVLYLIDQLF